MNTMHTLTKPMLTLSTALLLAGCATESYVNDKTAAVAARANNEFLRMETRLTSLDAQTSGLETQTRGLESRLGKNETNTGVAHKLAQDALDRANAAHQLATGKLVYTVTLTDGQIKFASGQAKLGKDAEQALVEVAKKLKAENRNVFIEIQGHTDNLGDKDLNKQLGLKRAEAVRDALYNAGLPLHRLSVISYGGSQPEAKGNTAKARAQNRRVLLLVLV